MRASLAPKSLHLPRVFGIVTTSWTQQLLRQSAKACRPHVPLTPQGASRQGDRGQGGRGQTLRYLYRPQNTVPLRWNRTSSAEQPRLPNRLLHSCQLVRIISGSMQVELLLHQIVVRAHHQALCAATRAVGR